MPKVCRWRKGWGSLGTLCKIEGVVIVDWLWKAARAVLKEALSDSSALLMQRFSVLKTGMLFFANTHKNANFLLLLVHGPLISRLSPTDNWFLYFSFVKNKRFFVSLLWWYSVLNLGKIFYFCSLGFLEEDDRPTPWGFAAWLLEQNIYFVCGIVC